jgi:HK97 family phage portal protein
MFNLFKKKSFNDQTTAQTLRASGVGVDFWQRDLGGYGSAGNPIVAECISIISNSIAQLSIHHYKDDVRVRGSNIEKLLREPNVVTTGTNLIETLVRQVLTHGNGHLYCKRGSNFKPESLWNATTTLPSITNEDSLIYSTVTIPSLQKMHQNVPHRLLGNFRFYTTIEQPLVGKLYEDDVADAVTLFDVVLSNANKYFSGSNEFETYLTTEMSMTSQQTSDLRSRMEELQKQGSSPILTSGLKAMSNPKNYTQAQLQEILLLCQSIIASGFSVPLPLLNNFSGNSTYKSSEEMINNFYNVNLNPFLDVIKTELERLLYVDGFTEELRFDLSAYKKTPSIMELSQAMQTSSFLSINEKREALGYAELEDNYASVVPELSDNDKYEAMLAGLGDVVARVDAKDVPVVVEDGTEELNEVKEAAEVI